MKDGKILRDPSKRVTIRASLKNTCNYVAFISCIVEPKNIKEVINDEYYDEINKESSDRDRISDI